jgi:hypothetical protein
MKNNFSTPGFLWPLLTLVCLVLILTGLRAVLKKTNWEKHSQSKILFGTTFILIIWIWLANRPFLQRLFYRFQQIAASSGISYAYTFTHYYFNSFL